VFLISLVAALLFTAFETFLFYTIGMGHVDLTTVGLALFFSWPILLVMWPYRLIVNLSLFGGQSLVLKPESISKHFFVPIALWVLYFGFDVTFIEPLRVSALYLMAAYAFVETAAFFFIRRVTRLRADTRSASA
jgi:hypothetical protein